MNEFMAQPSTQPMPRRQRGMGRAVLITALAIVIALLTAGVGGYLYTRGDDGPSAKADKPPPTPTFIEISPMTVNLAGDSRVLYIGLSLNVADSKTGDLLEAHMPEVRNRMLLTLSDKPADTLTSADGKRAIAKTLRRTLRAPYTPKGKPADIDNVLFTHFIVQ